MQSRNLVLLVVLGVIMMVSPAFDLNGHYFGDWFPPLSAGLMLVGFFLIAFCTIAIAESEEVKQ